MELASFTMPSQAVIISKLDYCALVVLILISLNLVFSLSNLSCAVLPTKSFSEGQHVHFTLKYTTYVIN